MLNRMVLFVNITRDHNTNTYTHQNAINVYTKCAIWWLVEARYAGFADLIIA